MSFWRETESLKTVLEKLHKKENREEVIYLSKARQLYNVNVRAVVVESAKTKARQVLTSNRRPPGKPGRWITFPSFRFHLRVTERPNLDFPERVRKRD